MREPCRLVRLDHGMRWTQATDGRPKKKREKQQLDAIALGKESRMEEDGDGGIAYAFRAMVRVHVCMYLWLLTVLGPSRRRQ